MDNRECLFILRFAKSLFGQILRTCKQITIFIQTTDQIGSSVANLLGERKLCNLSKQMLFQSFTVFGIEHCIIRFLCLWKFGFLIKVAQTFLKVVGFQPLCLAGTQIFIGITGQIFLNFDYRIFQHHLVEVVI